MKETISFEDFNKVDIKVAKIISVEDLKESKKLIKLTVDIGNEKIELLAGIKGYYNLEELIGKSIIIVTNLPPKKMMGLESKGMLLAAEDKGAPILLTTFREVPPGTEVK